MSIAWRNAAKQVMGSRVEFMRLVDGILHTKSARQRGELVVIIRLLNGADDTCLPSASEDIIQYVAVIEGEYDCRGRKPYGGHGGAIGGGATETFIAAGMKVVLSDIEAQGARDG